jgi:hypothetical protein
LSFFLRKTNLILRRETKMPIWEYKCENFSDKSGHKRDEILYNLGIEGWELVFFNCSQGEYYQMVFKRLKE